LDTQRTVSPLAPAGVLGVCLLLGLVVGGWVLGSEIKDIKLADRYVTVKGLVERTEVGYGNLAGELQGDGE
jgi:hypothetical protein